MRIISGNFKGTLLRSPKSMPFTRPTTEIARQGLFNILNNYINFENLNNTLDLFSGTGAISFELCSNGVKHATMVEKSFNMYSYLKQNAERLSIDNKCSIINEDVFSYLNSNKKSFDLIFAGPPYSLKNISEIPDIVFNKKMININSLFILEHTTNNNFANHPYLWMIRKYGTTIFSLFIGKK